MERIDNMQIACLMYKFIISSKGSDHLTVGFHQDIETRERELTNTKTPEGKNQVRI